MIKRITYTLGSRLILALLNVVLLLLTTRFMGAEAKGEISILVLNLSLGTLMAGFLGGPALVYLTPRLNNFTMLVINLFWSTLVLTGLTLFLHGFDLLSIEPLRFMRMAVMESFIATTLMMLLGQNNLRWHNIIIVLKALLTVCVIAYLVNDTREHFDLFVDAFDTSLFVCALVCAVLVLRGIKLQSKVEPVSIGSLVRQMWHFGFLVQTGNIAQLLNYRLSYYALEFIISPPQLALIRIGIYSAAIQVSEAVWQFTRSVSTVQYAAVSNMNDRGQALRLSLQLCKLNYTVSFLALLVMALTPTGVYTWVFGAEFTGVKTHFLLLSPGIMALAMKGAINHYYAGVGDHRFNTVTSVLGMILTAALVYPMILWWGSHGAAVVASLVYVTQLILQLRFLRQSDGVSLRNLSLSRQEMREFRQLLTRSFTSTNR